MNRSSDFPASITFTQTALCPGWNCMVHAQSAASCSVKRLRQSRLLQPEAAAARGLRGCQVWGPCPALKVIAAMQPWQHFCACIRHPGLPARPTSHLLQHRPLHPRRPLPRNHQQAELDGSRLQTQRRHGVAATQEATSTRCTTLTTSVTETSWDANKHPMELHKKKEKHFSPSPIGVLQQGLQCRGERRLD